MISAILKISLIGFALFANSCAVKEQTVQRQNNSNANSTQVIVPNQNTNFQSSNANTAKAKTLIISLTSNLNIVRFCSNG